MWVPGHKAFSFIPNNMAKIPASDPSLNSKVDLAVIIKEEQPETTQGKIWGPEKLMKIRKTTTSNRAHT